MTDTTTSGSAAVAFPLGKVQARLRSELLAAAKSAAELEGIAFPADVKAQASATIQIDSLVVVGLLCNVEPPLGFELRDHLVRAGGYTSVDEAVGHLLPRIEKEWNKRKGKGSTS
jgi:hypothetical protein